MHVNYPETMNVVKILHLLVVKIVDDFHFSNKVSDNEECLCTLMHTYDMLAPPTWHIISASFISDCNGETFFQPMAGRSRT